MRYKTGSLQSILIVLLFLCGCVLNSDERSRKLRVREIKLKAQTYYSKLSPPKSMSDCEFIPFDRPPRELPNRCIEDFLSYPVKAKKNGVEGNVIIKFYLDKDGYIDINTLEIIKGHPQLHQAVINALSNSSWEPATIQGIKVGACVTKKIIFKL